MNSLGPGLNLTNIADLNSHGGRLLWIENVLHPIDLHGASLLLGLVMRSSQFCSSGGYKGTPPSIEEPPLHYETHDQPQGHIF